MHILLTRPLEDCSEMIIKFQSLGHKVSHLPLLSIKKILHEKINLSEFKASISNRIDTHRGEISEKKSCSA